MAVIPCPHFSQQDLPPFLACGWQVCHDWLNRNQPIIQVDWRRTRCPLCQTGQLMLASDVFYGGTNQSNSQPWFDQQEFVTFFAFTKHINDTTPPTHPCREGKNQETGELSDQELHEKENDLVGCRWHILRRYLKRFFSVIIL